MKTLLFIVFLVVFVLVVLGALSARAFGEDADRSLLDPRERSGGAR